MSADTYHESVSEYYGKTIKKTTDLKFEACVVTIGSRSHHKEILSKIDPNVVKSYYGCGSPIPDPLEGTVVLDLGSGTGLDCFLISALSGSKGNVIGVDMTPEQIEVANKGIDYHKTNIPNASPIEFRQGFIEDLKTANIQDKSIDIVISNCVINLSSDKLSVFKEIYRVLKDGGEVHISDVFSDRTLPLKAKEDKILVGECIGNALSLTTFIAYMEIAGFKDLRVVECRKINLPEFPPELIEPGTVFYSITFSSFKGVDSIHWENDSITYKGGIPGNEESFLFDIHHRFNKGIPLNVRSNITSILKTPRYEKYFEFNKDEKAPEPPIFPDFLTSVFSTQNSGPMCSGGGCCGPDSKYCGEKCCESDENCCGKKCCESDENCCKKQMCHKK